MKRLNFIFFLVSTLSTMAQNPIYPNLIGSCNVTSTGGWSNWETFSYNPKDLSGVHELFLVFSGEGEYLFNIDKFQFHN